MRVTATQPGFYVKLRKAGEGFDVPAERFSARWMRAEKEAAEPEAEQSVEPVAVVVEAPLVTVEAPAEPVVKKRRGGRPRKVVVSE